MRFQSRGSRPRYPKQRNIPRILFLAALPVVLLCALLGLPSLFSDDIGDIMAAHGLSELAPEEAYPQGALPEGLLFDKLLVEKSLHRLTAFSAGKPVRVYLVALGENPLGHKEVEGDKRTPEGVYSIDGKNPKSAYHRNLGISYPNDADRARAAALRKSPGGDIKIHGLAPEFAEVGAAHRLTDWTYGCIAVTNEEIEELFARTRVGTPIEITP